MTSPVPAGAGGVDREAIRAREQAATPGPWARGRCDDGKECVNAPEWDGGVWVAVTEHWATDYATEDAEFIAHARSDVPALLDALAEAEDVLSAVNDALMQGGQTEAIRAQQARFALSSRSRAALRSAISNAKTPMIVPE